MSILVAKADGLTEPFDEHKLLQSLKRAGAETLGPGNQTDVFAFASFASMCGWR